MSMSAPLPPPVELPLRGVRVLVTRPWIEGERLRRSLRAAGALVLDLPTIAVGPPESYGPLDTALSTLSGYDWIVFTSRNAVKAVVERLAALGSPPVFPVTLWVAAVGPATAADLRRRGVYVDAVPESAAVNFLSGELQRRGVSGTRLLLPQGTLSGRELQDDLERSGASVDAVIAYQTVQPSALDGSVLDAVQRGEVDVVALASPSAAYNLAHILAPHGGCAMLRDVCLVCIGPSTAAAVRDLHLRPACVAEQHTLDGLVQAIVNLYRMEESNEPG